MFSKIGSVIVALFKKNMEIRERMRNPVLTPEKELKQEKFAFFEDKISSIIIHLFGVALLATTSFCMMADGSFFALIPFILCTVILGSIVKTIRKPFKSKISHL